MTTMGRSSYDNVIKGRDQGQHKDLMKHLKKMNIPLDIMDEFE